MSVKVRRRGKSWQVIATEHKVRKYVTVHSEQEVKELVKALALGKLAEVSLRETFQQVAGTRQPVANTTPASPFPKLRDALPAWIEQCERRGEIRGSTPIGYRSACETWLYPVLGDVPVNEITRKMIGAVIGKIKDAGRSRSTIGHIRNPLRTYFADQIEQERLETNPAADVQHFIGKKKVTAKVEDADYFRQEDGPQLLQTAKAAYPRHYAYIATTLLLGLRRGESAALYVSDIDWAGKRIHVQRSFNDQTHRGRAHEERPRSVGRRERYAPGHPEGAHRGGEARGPGQGLDSRAAAAAVPEQRGADAAAGPVRGARVGAAPAQGGVAVQEVSRAPAHLRGVAARRGGGYPVRAAADGA
jgi:hypothetical protein